jgi:hypothetical protein
MPQIFAIIKQQKTVEQLPLKAFFQWFLHPQFEAKHHWLVVWNFFKIFHSVGNVIIPTDELHHFSEGRLKPPTKSLLTIINHIISININHIWLILIITINHH